MTFSPELSYRLAERVALRPEPFGALAYHYGTRRLTFLNSPELVRLVERLGEHHSARGAFDACAIDERRWPSFASALGSLVASGFLEPVSGGAGQGRVVASARAGAGEIAP